MGKARTDRARTACRSNIVAALRTESSRDTDLAGAVVFCAQDWTQQVQMDRSGCAMLTASSNEQMGQQPVRGKFRKRYLPRLRNLHLGGQFNV